MVEFVNPYTFVPIVMEPDRRAPVGHDSMPDEALSGVLDVTWTARSPLLLGGYERAGETGKVEPDLPRRQGGEPGTVMLPGSSLLGAVRSLHEALVGGCLRVLDTDYAAVHRHPAASQQGLKLAVVVEVDAKGCPVRVAVCRREV